MRLRPRQQQAVDASYDALAKHNNTLLVAPTGAGKTIMLSAVSGRRVLNAKPDRPNKALILQHRDELVAQNTQKFRKVNPSIPVSLFNADHKSWNGRAVFGMVQTLSRTANLATIPELDSITVDEAHHAVAAGYQAIIEQARKVNPNVAIFGVTATPNRGDGKGLREVFDNVADEITIGELIASGHLVRPRTYVMEVGVTAALQSVRKLATDFDMSAVAAIMDRAVITDRVVELWKNGDPARQVPSCADRKTIVFCSTVEHAEHVCEVFKQAGVKAVAISGTDKTARRYGIEAYERGDAQVLVNVAIATEGYDYPPTSCVILLRPSSFKSTMIQMIGRGLRTIDEALYPGVVKTDCVVLDFGTSSLTHGTLEETANLDGRPKTGEVPMKVCPEDMGGCGASVPIGTLECPLCGYQWERQPKERSDLHDFVMTEIDLLAKSNFKWIDIWHDESALMATGMEAWAGIFWWQGLWHTVGGSKNELRHLGIGDRIVALALADDWLNDHETDNSAYKTKRWMKEPASIAQLTALRRDPADVSLSKYQAACRITFNKNQRAIQHLVLDRAQPMREAA